MSTALVDLADSLKSNPETDYIHAFCFNLEQEMIHMPKQIMEDLKDEVTETILKKRKLLRDFNM